MHWRVDKHSTANLINCLPNRMFGGKTLIPCVFTFVNFSARTCKHGNNSGVLLLVTAGQPIYPPVCLCMLYAGEPSAGNCKFGLLINQHGRARSSMPLSQIAARHGTLSKHPISIISMRALGPLLFC